MDTNYLTNLRKSSANYMNNLLARARNDPSILDVDPPGYSSSKVLKKIQSDSTNTTNTTTHDTNSTIHDTNSAIHDK